VSAVEVKSRRAPHAFESLEIHERGIDALT